MADAEAGGAVDTHCHLFLLERDVQEVLDEARAAGVDSFVCAGIDPATSRGSVELAESFRGVFATAGMHPHTAADLNEEGGAEIEELLANPQVVAVGETGLDFFRMRSPREEQERVLRLHVRWSREFDKPLVVHVRDAWESVERILVDEGAERVVLHCFTGDEETARRCAGRGWYLSFAGNLTYPKNEAMRRAAAAAPGDRILVETDSPFLSPQRLRGRDNAPGNVVDVVETLAQARGEAADAALRATAANARSAFPGLK